MVTQQIPVIESDTAAFETTWTPSVPSTLCAFANSDGGIIYFGVQKDGGLMSVKNVAKQGSGKNTCYRLAS